MTEHMTMQGQVQAKACFSQYNSAWVRPKKEEALPSDSDGMQRLQMIRQANQLMKDNAKVGRQQMMIQQAKREAKGPSSVSLAQAREEYTAAMYVKPDASYSDVKKSNANFGRQVITKLLHAGVLEDGVTDSDVNKDAKSWVLIRV